VHTLGCGALTTLVHESWRSAGRAAYRDAVRSAALCFGDSVVKLGVAPTAIEAVTGRPAYNLATFGGPPALSFVLLRRALESGARPNAVIIALHSANLSISPRYYEQSWQRIATARECLDLALTARDPEFFGALVAGRLFPSIRSRFEIRALVRLELHGQKPVVRPDQDVVTHRRNWQANRGGAILPAHAPHAIEADLANTYLFPTFWERNREESVYVHRFCALAAAHGIPVFCVLPPVAPAAQEARVRLGLDATYTQVVRSLLRRHREVVIVDARRSEYPDAAFADMVHLNSRGASVLSAELADLVTHHRDRASSRGRWIHLAPYHERPNGVALEDLDRSRVLLQR
jgi:hypothetical protein